MESGATASSPRNSPMAMRRPATAATAPSTAFSTSSSRTSSPRPAPIAWRSASSRRRSAPRAITMLATFAQVASSTMPTPPSRIRSSCLRPGDRSFVKGDDAGVGAVVVGAVGLLEAARNHGHLRLRGGKGDTGREACDDAQVVRGPARRVHGRFARQPDVGPRRIGKALRHHADHLGVPPVCQHRERGEIAVGREQARPERVAHDDGRRAVRAGLVLGERPAERRRHAERGKELPRDGVDAGDHRLAPADHRAAPSGGGSERREAGRALLPVLEVRCRDGDRPRPIRGFPERDDAIRVRDRGAPSAARRR